MRCAIALLSLLALGAAEPPSATVTCIRATDPGRVRCEVEARAAKGTTIRTADLVVTRVPPFAAALRGRLGPPDASAREDAAWRWAIAFAAKSRGEGELAVRVRVVACTAPDVCAPYEIDARAPLVVGP